MVVSQQNAMTAYVHRLSLARVYYGVSANDFVADLELNAKTPCGASFRRVRLAFRGHLLGSVGLAYDTRNDPLVMGLSRTVASTDAFTTEAGAEVETGGRSRATVSSS